MVMGSLTTRALLSVTSRIRLCVPGGASAAVIPRPCAVTNGFTRLVRSTGGLRRYVSLTESRAICAPPNEAKETIRRNGDVTAAVGLSTLTVGPIDVNDILGRLDEARVRLSLVILDACRDNPFPRRFRSSSRGLAQLDAPRGTMIAYATAPGETAADGEGSNGLYTEQLLKVISMPGLKLEDVFKRAIDGVAQRSGNKQTPWVSSSFRGSSIFSTT